MAKDIHSIKECPDCASDNIFYKEEKEQVICRDCGLIYEPLEPRTEQKFEHGHGIQIREKKSAEKKKPKKK